MKSQSIQLLEAMQKFSNISVEVYISKKDSN